MSVSSAGSSGANESAHPRSVLAVVCAALFFGVLNASAVGVILPEMGAAFDVGVGQLGWVMTGFLLVYGIAIPFYGRLADLHGARRLFLLGVAVFAVGSLLVAIAPSFPALLAARIVQAAGGAAVPGLGMTLASRAYGAASRGTVLGVIGATIGIGAAVGPLVGGALSGAFGWQSVFAVNAAAALTIPVGLIVLPRGEETVEGSLDLLGGSFLALGVIGLLLAPTEISRSGWASPGAAASLAIIVAAGMALTLRQRHAPSPFIPQEFLVSAAFIALVSMSFLAMAANLGALIAIPVMLGTVNRLGPLEVGVVMLPGAALTAVSGVVAGRLVASVNTRVLVTLGAGLLVVAMVGLSTVAGDDVRAVALAAALLGLGFGLVNTPLVTAVSQSVRPQLMSSALAINSMLFFIGGSIGAAILLGISSAAGGNSLNPLHRGSAAGFSDGFLFLAAPALAVVLLALKLPGSVEPDTGETLEQLERPLPFAWHADCSLPWVPECELVGSVDVGKTPPTVATQSDSTARSRAS